MAPLVLASGSPRRKELLAGLGLDFEVLVPGIPELPAPGEPPEKQVLRLATEKARAVARLRPGAVVLAADTEVVLDGRSLGKPADAVDAAAMLRALCGRSHQVVSGVCVLGPALELAFPVKTQVALRRASEAELAWYVGTGEPLDKAGAYAIQGRGGFLVAAIGGSYSNVVGLPLAETVAALQRAGVAFPWGQR